MAASDTAKLLASLTLKDGFTGPLKKMDGSLNKFDAHLKSTDTRAFKAGKQIGTGIKAGAVIAAGGIAFLATQIGFGLRSLSDLEDAETQTNAVLTSTKGIAGVTAKEVRGLAEEYENLNATIDDKVIQSGENLLLTFTNVRKEAFEPALAAALDMNTALGRGPDGLNTTITQLGKALNDPAKGITALRKAGVLFTDDQIKQIKALQKSGDLLGAQRIILQELGTEFGGSFAKQGKTAKATIAGIGDAGEDLQKTLASGLFPVIQKVLPKIRDALASPAVLHGAEQLGDAIAGLFSDQNINEGARVIGDLFDTAKEAAPVIASAAQITGDVIKAGVGAFRSLPPEIQALAVAGFAVNKLTGGLVTNIAGGLISAVISSFRGLMNVNAATVVVNGPVAPGVPGGGGGGLLGTAAKFVIPVAVAAITIEAAKALTDAIDPGLSDPNNTQLGQRDPRRFNKDGQVVQNYLKQTAVTGDHTLDEIERIRRDANRQDDRSYDSIEKLRGAITTETLSVDVANAAAIGQAFSAAQVRAVITADQKARGIKPSGPSKTIAPRLQFLRGGHSGEKDVAVADALALGFERGKSPAFKSTDALKRAIKAVSADIKTLPPKFTGPLTDDLKRLKAELGRRTEKAAKDAAAKQALATRLGAQRTVQAVKDKDSTTSLTINNKTGVTINGRLLDAATTRFQTVFSSSGNLGGVGAR